MDDESRYRWYELLLLAMVAGMLLISVLAVGQICATPGPRFYETPETSPATLPDTTRAGQAQL